MTKDLEELVKETEKAEGSLAMAVGRPVDLGGNDRTPLAAPHLDHEHVAKADDGDKRLQKARDELTKIEDDLVVERKNESRASEDADRDRDALRDPGGMKAHQERLTKEARDLQNERVLIGAKLNTARDHLAVMVSEAIQKDEDITVARTNLRLQQALKAEAEAELGALRELRGQSRDHDRTQGESPEPFEARQDEAQEGLGALEKMLERLEAEGQTIRARLENDCDDTEIHLLEGRVGTLVAAMSTAQQRIRDHTRLINKLDADAQRFETEGETAAGRAQAHRVSGCALVAAAAIAARCLPARSDVTTALYALAAASSSLGAIFANKAEQKDHEMRCARERSTLEKRQEREQEDVLKSHQQTRKAMEQSLVAASDRSGDADKLREREAANRGVLERTTQQYLDAATSLGRLKAEACMRAMKENELEKRIARLEDTLKRRVACANKADAILAEELTARSVLADHVRSSRDSRAQAVREALDVDKRCTAKNAALLAQRHATRCAELSSTLAPGLAELVKQNVDRTCKLWGKVAEATDAVFNEAREWRESLQVRREQSERAARAEAEAAARAHAAQQDTHLSAVVVPDPVFSGAPPSAEEREAAKTRLRDILTEMKRDDLLASIDDPARLKRMVNADCNALVKLIKAAENSTLPLDDATLEELESRLEALFKENIAILDSTQAAHDEMWSECNRVDNLPDMTHRMGPKPSTELEQLPRPAAVPVPLTQPLPVPARALDHLAHGSLRLSK